MNDLTKDELNFIFEMMIKFRHADLTQYNNVLLKIKSMIDNYHYCNFDMQEYCSKCKGWKGMDGCYERE